MDVHASNTYMKSYIAELYVIVFSLLVDIMTWFRSSFRRLIHSFDSAYFDDLIKSKQDNMQKLAQKLENEGKLATEAKIQQLPTKAEIDLIVSEKLARFMQELEKRQGMLGKLVQTSIRDEVGSYIWRDKFAVSSASFSPAIMGYDSPVGSIMPVQRYSTSQIQANGYRLQKYREYDAVAALIDQAVELSLNTEVFLRIQTWTGSSKCQTLLIQGPFQASFPSRYTLMSAYLVSTARKADIPVIQYFLQHPGDRQTSTSGSDSDDETDNTADDGARLVYSLISQLLEFLPPGALESEFDFSSTRFASLSTSAEPLPVAISLLRDLLSIGPPLLFCVIDGLQFLAPGTLGGLWSLVDLLRGPRKDDRVLKVLYTTDGFVDALGKLDDDERMSVLDFECEEAGPGEFDAVDVGLLTEF